MPVEASPARSSPSTGELTAIVTILHDRTRGDREGAALRASSSSPRASSSAGSARPRASWSGRTSSCSASISSSSRPRARIAVPGQRVARVSHAAQRDPRLHEHAAPGHRRRADRRTSARTWHASTPTAGTCWRSSTTFSTSRDRGRPMPRSRLTEFPAAELVTEVIAEMEPLDRALAARGPGRRRGRRRLDRQRPQEDQADPDEPDEQRAQVHAPGLDPDHCQPRATTGW